MVGKGTSDGGGSWDPLGKDSEGTIRFPRRFLRADSKPSKCQP